MAYKNKAKQKKHIQDLKSIGRRKDNEIRRHYQKMMASLPNTLSTNEKEEILKRRGQI